MEKPAYQTLTEFWAANKADINYGPTSPEAIASLENRYSLKLPPDFRDYLLNACPIGVDQMDRELTTWWEFDRLKTLEAESKPPLGYRIEDPLLAKDARHYIVFADYMLWAWAWAWAICCLLGDNYGRILQLYKTEDFVSNSFGEFVQSYIELWDKGLFLSEIN